MLCTQPRMSPRHPFCQGLLSAILTFIKYTAVAKSARAKQSTCWKTRQTLVFPNMTCCVTAGAASACKPLKPCNRRTLRPNTAEPLTLCMPLPGRQPSSSWSRTIQATHSPPASSRSPRLRDAHATAGDVHVLGIDGTCARAAATLNRCLYLYARIPKQLPKP